MRLRDKNGRFIKTTKIVLRNGTKGKNARGVCLHKRTRGARRVKGQFANSGLRPRGL